MGLRTPPILTLALVLSLLAAPLGADAQPAGKVPRIGVLVSHSPEGSCMDALRDGLREFGYVEGQNIAIEWRLAHEKVEQAIRHPATRSASARRSRVARSLT